METVLEAQQISKSFGGVRALNNVSIDVQRGEVLAVVGENGAGKSTLMKILNGLLSDYRGQVYLFGKKVHWRSPIAARIAGIGYIPQEISLVPEMTAAENIFLGRERPNRLGMVDSRRMNEEADEYLRSIGADFSPQVKVARLGAGDQQLVEIARALSMQGRILIMDEPTSALAGREIDRLFDIIRRLSREGRSIIYISHKLDEVMAVADRVAVLKDGELIWQKPAKRLSKEEIVSAMVGRAVLGLERSQKEGPAPSALITIEHLELSRRIRDVSFDVREGEILGIAGLMGSGRTEVLLALYGVLKPRQGRITFAGGASAFSSPEQAASNRFALVPEERKSQGLILEHPVSENIVLCMLKRLSRYGILSKKRESKAVAEMISYLSIKVDRPSTAAKSLSGGNQQKVVLAKCLANQPRILLLDEATHGIDVGAKQEIYSLIRELNAKGMTIIMASSELQELMSLCDRILVLREGRSVGMLSGREATEEKIIRLATGGVQQ